MSDTEEIEKILQLIKDALGGDQSYFNLSLSEILNNDEEYFSITILVEPNNEYIRTLNMKAVGGQNYLEASKMDGEYSLMVGEDGCVGLDVSRANIYSQLYWGEVMEEL